MSIQRFEPTSRHSHVVIHSGIVYLSGQVSDRGGSITDQTKHCLERIDRLLAIAGSDKTKILQTTVWLADIVDFGAMNAVWEAWAHPKHLPSRSTCQVKLVEPRFKVEITVVAAVDSTKMPA
jgi:enamine deaminase RidA (YjgF/YER057c/UK114 family)